MKFAISILLLLVACRLAVATELAPRADEAILLGKLQAGDMRLIEFRRFGATDEFYLLKSDLLKPQIVKAGRYYVRSFTPFAANLGIPVFREPADDHETIEIRAQSVTYIGNIGFVKEGSPNDPVVQPRMYFVPETLLAVEKRFPFLTRYPLFIARAGHEPQAVTWSSR